MDSDKTAKTKEEMRKETREWIIALALAVCAAVIIRVFIFELVIVEQSSMFPTLTAGEKLGVLKIAYLIDEPEYEDIVVFVSNDDEDKSLVKRVIATEGQSIYIEDNIVYVNDVALDEFYLTEDQYSYDFPYTLVPEGHMFVMGDNRLGSSDSRSFGFVSYDQVKGRIIFRLSPFHIFKKLN